MAIKTLVDLIKNIEQYTKPNKEPSGRNHIRPTSARVVAIFLLATIVVATGFFLVGCKKTPEETPTEKVLAFAVFSTHSDLAFSQGIADILRKDNDRFGVVIAPSIEQAIESQAEVLIFAMERREKVSEPLATALKTRKVIGIGYGTAQLFGQLGLEINGGACAHGSDRSPRIRIQANDLTGKPESVNSFTAFNISSDDPKAQRIDFNFSMHIPEKSHLRSVVDVIARSVSKEYPHLENYASIARQGNYILIGLAAPPNTWTPRYCEFFRQLSRSLYSRPREEFSTAQWGFSVPGTYEFKLAEGRSTKELCSRILYFKFSKPTAFSAHLEHKGSNAIMLLFMGEVKGTKHIRKDAKQGEPLEIAVDISEEDISILGDRYWRLKVTNFDRGNTADCLLNIQYDAGAAGQPETLQD